MDGVGAVFKQLFFRIQNVSAVDGFLYFDAQGNCHYQRLGSCLEYFLESPSNLSEHDPGNGSSSDSDGLVSAPFDSMMSSQSLLSSKISNVGQIGPKVLTQHGVDIDFKNNVCHVENQSPQPLESKFELSLPDITAINQALDIKFPRESDVEIMSDPFMEQNIFGSFSTNKPVNSRRQKLHQNESNRPSKCKDVCCEPGASADLYKSNGYKPSDLGRGLGVRCRQK